MPWSAGGLPTSAMGWDDFLLQAFNEPAFVRNFQTHLLVENVDDCHAKC